MELTKAQKAAIARIEQLIEEISRYSYEDGDNVQGCMHEIKTIIEKFDFNKKRDLLEKIYDSLMKKSFYKTAASFAEKYGL